MINKQFDVYVSHSRADLEWTKRLVEKIEQHEIDDGHTARHIRTFFAPRDIPVGYSFADYMLEMVKRIPAFLLIITPECLRSEWTSREFSTARRNKKYIIPLYHRDRSLDGKTQDPLFHLRDLNYIDFRDESVFEIQVQKLTQIIRTQPQDPAGATAFDWTQLHPLLEILKRIKVEEKDSQREKTPKTFKTLEQAFEYVVDRLGLLISDEGGLIGCAWPWQDNRLLCIEDVGATVHKQIADGKKVILCRARSGQDYRNIVKNVEDSEYPHLKVIRINARYWQPKLIHIVWDNTIGMTQANCTLGAIACELHSGKSIGNPVLARFDIKPGWKLKKQQNPGDIIPGTPFFDKSGRLVGFVSCPSPMVFQPFSTRP